MNYILDKIMPRTAKSRETHIIIFRKLSVQDQALQVHVTADSGIRSPLTSLDAHNDIAHDFKLPPIDALEILTHKCAISLLSRNQIPTVKG